MNLDFLVIAPTPFFVNRGCHMRIRGEAEVLQKAGKNLLIMTYKEGADVEGLKIVRSPVSVGIVQKEVSATWKNLPAGFFLFWSILHETIYQQPKVLYGHLFEGAAIGIAVKYIVYILSLFKYKPILVLDAQGSLTKEMQEYGMVKDKSLLLTIFRLIEKFILFFPDHIFVSSLQCADDLKKIRPHSNSIYLPDGVSLFSDNLRKDEIGHYKILDGKLKALAKITDTFSSEQREKVEKWLVEKRVIVLYTGSYSDSKGFPAFISSALPKLLKNESVRFLFGGGEIENVSGLDKLVNDNPGKIISINNLNEKNLLYFSLLGDIAIDCKPPHTSESSGKILNYMAVGLPVVCFNQKNNRHFLKEGGLYAKDFSFFADNILALVGDTGTRNRMSEKNLERVWEEFTWEKTAVKILETLQI